MHRFAEVAAAEEDVTHGAAADYRRRPGMGSLGLVLTYLSAATIPWTAVNVVGSVGVGEVLLVLALGTLLLADPGRRLPSLPPWVWALTAGILLTGVTNQFLPPSQDYLAHRDLLLGSFVIHQGSLPNTNLPVMFHLAVRVLLLPLVFGLAAGHDRRALVRIALSFVGGVAICSLIAFLDSRGVTSIGSSFVGVSVADGRASGLTDHPNVVAMTCVMALPVAVWGLQALRGRSRVLIVLASITLLLGLYASRSRSGAVAAAIAGVLALLWMPRFRRHLPTVGLLLAGLAGALFVANPGLGSALLSGLRLTGGDTAGSDQARDIVNDQATRDFLHAPIRGIGFEVAEQAHMVYLQALAVGGLILLAALVIYLGGSLVRGARLARQVPIALPLFVSVLGESIFNALQNALTPAIAYLTTSLIAAIPVAQVASSSSSAASTRDGGIDTSS